ncbi:MAG: ABC transporter ATP-binding protein [Clostridia bacterium]|nr:ABC transporter ATP-binding protein [Clostridia bacterium]
MRSEKDIKSLGLEDKLSEVSEENYIKYRKARFKHDMTDSWFGQTRNFFISTVSTLALILGIVFIDKGLLTLASFMIINSNKDSLYRIIWNTGYISNAFVDIRVSCERMFALFDEKEFVTEHFGKTNLNQIKGNIEFKNVSYSFKEYKYDDKTDKSKKLKSKQKVKPKLISENKVFTNLSFKIKPHTTVAFVGKSGSGKSTILNLMSKMYEVDSGEVLIDGVNINKLNKKSLRNGISLVNQFPYIFDMTIKENLLLAKGNATDKEIVDAIKKASLKEFIDTLPNGIDTKVGESGIKLSGGQKQRLAIARALLRKSNIIIFDESTSSLDNFAQEEVKKSIDNLKGKSTIVIVAHRLSTIKNVDTIFFLDNGEIIDTGTFEELFERNDKFKAMFLAENI